MRCCEHVFHNAIINNHVLLAPLVSWRQSRLLAFLSLSLWSVFVESIPVMSCGTGDVTLVKYQITGHVQLPIPSKDGLARCDDAAACLHLEYVFIYLLYIY